MTRRFMVAATLSLCLSLTAAGQELASWHCLPEETIAAVRVPNGRAFVDALRQRTKFGAVMFSEERVERAKQIFFDHFGEEWNEAAAEMEDYGIEPADYLKLFDGEVGVGVVIEPLGEQPLVVALMWGEPGAQTADRLINAFADGLMESRPQGFEATREDIELAGVEVIDLTMPEVGYPAPIDFDAEWQREPQQESPLQADGPEGPGGPLGAEPMMDMRPRIVNHTHFMLARIGDRFVMATCRAQMPEQVQDALEAGEDVDFEKWTGVETARGVLARFIAAHEGQGGAFAQQLIDVPGMNNALPEGEVAFEAYGSFKQMIALGRTLGEARGLDNAKIFETLGLDTMGVAGWRMALNDQTLHNGMFVQMPAPRRGVPAMFEQPEQEPQPPAWVPADIYQYQHVSMDLGKLYTAIKQLTIEVGGEETAFYFQMVEGQAMQMIQSDMAAILSALGTRHSVLTYLPTQPEVQPADDEAQQGPVGTPVLTQRMAIVWELKDEALWQKMLQMIGAFAQAGGGQMQFAEEQGFTGWRYNDPALEGGLFIGKGFMVLGIGPGAVENALSVISNPPSGDAALRNTPQASRARDLLELRPGLMYQFDNTAQHMESIHELFLSAFDAGMLGQAGMIDARQAELLQDLKEVMPSSDEMQGIIGVGVGQAWLDENGLAVQSALEMPPAD